MDIVVIQRIDAFHGLVIAAAYLGIGLIVAPRVYFGQSSHQGATIAKWSSIVFLISCAITHAEIAFHGITNTPYPAGEIFHVVVHAIQAWSASTFLIFATLFLDVNIGLHKKRGHSDD